MLLSVSLAACDGSINFTDEGSVKNASVKEIFRGLAQDQEMINEDPKLTENRRSAYVVAANRTGVNTKKKLMDAIYDNPNYSDVNITGHRMPGNDETMDIVEISFKVMNEFNVKINFLVPEKKIAGPLRLNKLPIMNSINTTTNDDQQINLGADAEVFAKMLNKNPDLLKMNIQRRWKIQQASNAAAADEKLQSCKAAAMSNEGDIEPNPALNDDENKAEIKKIQDDIDKKIDVCIHS